jgi:hypothetical protein
LGGREKEKMREEKKRREALGEGLGGER